SVFMLPVLVFSAVIGVQDPAVPQADAQQSSRAGAPQQFDQTINVPKGARVEVRDCLGEAVVKTWNRDAVQVRATGARRSNMVKATLTDKALTITPGN